jgi:hypothetical protein
LPAADLRLVAGAGHFLPLDAPETLREAVTEMLEGAA